MEGADPPPEMNEEVQAAFRAQLEANGLIINDCKGDGNCLFRAVSHQVYRTQNYHAQIRHYCVEYMRVKEAEFRPFITERPFEGYLHDMSQNSVWGGDPEIKALCQMYHRPRSIMYWEGDASNGSLTEVGLRGTEPGPPLLLSFLGGNHYNSLLSADSPAPLQSPVGVVEEAAIQRARRETGNGNVGIFGGIGNLLGGLGGSTRKSPFIANNKGQQQPPDSKQHLHSDKKVSIFEQNTSKKFTSSQMTTITHDYNDDDDDDDGIILIGDGGMNDRTIPIMNPEYGNDDDDHENDEDFGIQLNNENSRTPSKSPFQKGIGNKNQQASTTKGGGIFSSSKTPGNYNNNHTAQIPSSTKKPMAPTFDTRKRISSPSPKEAVPDTGSSSSVADYTSGKMKKQQQQQQQPQQQQAQKYKDSSIFPPPLTSDDDDEGIALTHVRQITSKFRNRMQTPLKPKDPVPAWQTEFNFISDADADTHHEEGKEENEQQFHFNPKKIASSIIDKYTGIDSVIGFGSEGSEQEQQQQNGNSGQGLHPDDLVGEGDGDGGEGEGGEETHQQKEVEEINKKISMVKSKTIGSSSQVNHYSHSGMVRNRSGIDGVRPAGSRRVVRETVRSRGACSKICSLFKFW